MSARPGQWQVRTYDGPLGFCVDYITESVGRNVAANLDERDALLIAAAPDLLAACQAMIESNMGQPSGVHVPALDSMRHAVARATGEDRGRR